MEAFDIAEPKWISVKLLLIFVINFGGDTQWANVAIVAKADHVLQRLFACMFLFCKNQMATRMPENIFL